MYIYIPPVPLYSQIYTKLKTIENNKSPRVSAVQIARKQQNALIRCVLSEKCLIPRLLYKPSFNDYLWPNFFLALGLTTRSLVIYRGVLRG